MWSWMESSPAELEDSRDTHSLQHWCVSAMLKRAWLLLGFYYPDRHDTVHSNLNHKAKVCTFTRKHRMGLLYSEGQSNRDLTFVVVHEGFPFMVPWHHNCYVMSCILPTARAFEHKCSSLNLSWPFCVHFKGLKGKKFGQLTDIWHLLPFVVSYWRLLDGIHWFEVLGVQNRIHPQSILCGVLADAERTGSSSLLTFWQMLLGHSLCHDKKTKPKQKPELKETDYPPMTI